MLVEDTILVEIHHSLVDLDPCILKCLYKIHRIFISRLKVAARIRIRRIGCKSEQCHTLAGKRQYIIVIFHNDCSFFSFPHGNVFRSGFHFLEGRIVTDKSCRILIRISNVTLGSQKVVDSCAVSVCNVRAHDRQCHHGSSYR